MLASQLVGRMGLSWLLGFNSRRKLIFDESIFFHIQPSTKYGIQSGVHPGFSPIIKFVLVKRMVNIRFGLIKSHFHHRQRFDLFEFEDADGNGVGV